MHPQTVRLEPNRRYVGAAASVWVRVYSKNVTYIKNHMH
jgi:hypothetical protein